MFNNQATMNIPHDSNSYVLWSFFFGMAHLVQILARAGISFNTTKQV